MRKGKAGQTTFEYIILVAAVIAVVIAFVSSPFFQDNVSKVMDSAVNQLDQKIEGVDF